MSILLVEVPVDAVAIDEAMFPDRDASHILEHLIRYCGKFDPLPAITISLERGRAVVIRGHKYLVAARALERRAIRAVVANAPLGEDVKTFLARPDVNVLDWEGIKAHEAQEPMPTSWHVFFFARALSPEEKSTFDAVIESLFLAGSIPVVHEDAGPLAEFQAKTPATDPAWAARHLAVFTSFSREHVPIVSFQGRRLGSAS